MKYQKLNKNWNPEPNAPELSIEKSDNGISLTVTLDHAAYQHIDAGDKGMLNFTDVYAYRIAALNEAGYLQGQYRFSHTQLPWGQCYELVNSTWKQDFPQDKLVLNESLIKSKLRHFILFLKDEVIECLAMDFSFSFVDTISDLLDEIYPKGYFNYYISMFASQFDKATVSNYQTFTNLYLQIQNKKEFTELKNELKTIKANKHLGLYLKFANIRKIENFGMDQLHEMIKVIESYKIDK